MKWSRNGSDISTDARIKITRSKHREEVYNLTLDLIKGEDCGDFQVTAENKMGKVVSSTKVTVSSEFIFIAYHIIHTKSSLLLIHTRNRKIECKGRIKNINFFLNIRKILYVLKWKKNGVYIKLYRKTWLLSKNLITNYLLSHKNYIYI